MGTGPELAILVYVEGGVCFGRKKGFLNSVRGLPDSTRRGDVPSLVEAESAGPSAGWWPDPSALLAGISCSW